MWISGIWDPLQYKGFNRKFVIGIILVPVVGSNWSIEGNKPESLEEIYTFY